MTRTHSFRRAKSASQQRRQEETIKKPTQRRLAHPLSQSTCERGSRNFNERDHRCFKREKFPLLFLHGKMKVFQRSEKCKQKFIVALQLQCTAVKQAKPKHPPPTALEAQEPRSTWKRASRNFNARAMTRSVICMCPSVGHCSNSTGTRFSCSTFTKASAFPTGAEVSQALAKISRGGVEALTCHFRFSA